jgi:DNA-binding IclR family transcriptional regulator
MGITDPAAPAVHRAATIVDFLMFKGVASPTTLAAELGLSKSSLSDILTTMLADGLIRKRDDGLVIGPLFAELTKGFVGETALMDRFAITWQRQRLLSEHTVSVQTVIGTHSLCVEVRHGAHLLPFTPLPGLRSDVWVGIEGEPVLRCLTAEQVRYTTTTFAAFSPAVEERVDEGRNAWIARHALGRQRIPLVAHTGNLEFNTPLSRGGDMPPAVLTLHLPPHLEGRVSHELRSAFEDFAAPLSS